MGANCCSREAPDNAHSDLTKDEPVPVLSDGIKPAQGKESEGPGCEPIMGTYHVTLNKADGRKLGLDVDYMEGRVVLPITGITGGLAEEWNKEHPDNPLTKGDSIVEVNGTRDNVVSMLEKCKSDTVVDLTVKKAFTYDHLVDDLEKLVTSKGCGPILIRLSWHDAGVFCDGKLKGGCPNAAMRFKEGGESAFPANAGLPTVALNLLSPITKKYCPELISNADLWALAANVAIRIMGGPDISTRFGRADAKSSGEAVESQAGRLPEGDKGAAHLREIFNAKHIEDKGIVALSGAHTVGRCHLDRTGFDGAWTENPLKFDNSYFQELLTKKYKAETTAKGSPQHRNAATNTIMLTSDLALMEDPAFVKHVEKYAADQDLFFANFTEAWLKMQENGCGNLREIL